MSILGQTTIKKGKHLPLAVCTQQRQHEETKILPHIPQKSGGVFSVHIPHKNTTFMFFCGLEASC